MNRVKVTHLIDDQTPGGVMRMVSHLMEHPQVQARVSQTIQPVNPKGLRGLPPLDGDVLVSHLPFSWRGLPALFAMRANNPDKMLVHIEHHYTRAFTALNVPNKKRFFSMLRIAYSLFDRVIAVSRDQRDWLEERQLARPENLRVVHPCVDLAPFAAVKPPTTHIETFGAIGRLERQKGFDLLIEAFQSQQDLNARLLVYGEGSERTQLETLAKGDTRIEFRGHAAKPEQAYETVDAIVMPSRWEAYGLVADEALAARRPVIASAVDGLKDRVVSGRATRVDLDPGSIARVLRQVLDAPNLAKQAQPSRPSMSHWMDALTPKSEPALHVGKGLGTMNIDEHPVNS